MFGLFRATALLKVSLILLVGCLGGCVTARQIEPSTVSKYEGFIIDGGVTRQEILGRLGSAMAVFENGRILIYHVHLQEDGRMTLEGKGACYACVLVFDESNVLERHSLVKHGCQ